MQKKRSLSINPNQITFPLLLLLTTVTALMLLSSNIQRADCSSSVSIGTGSLSLEWGNSNSTTPSVADDQEFLMQSQFYGNLLAGGGDPPGIAYGALQTKPICDNKRYANCIVKLGDRARPCGFEIRCYRPENQETVVCGGGVETKSINMSSRKGPPKHQNKLAWKPNAGVKINETELGGKFRPYSEITGVCQRCKEQIEWKRRYGKYKPLTEPAKCQKCSKRAVRQAYHNLCTACSKENKVCAKCLCRVEHIVGRDISEAEAEQKTLDEAIKSARERDRRTLLRTMNKGKPHSSAKMPPSNHNKAGELFTASSLDEYAEGSRDEGGDSDDDEDDGVILS